MRKEDIKPAVRNVKARKAISLIEKALRTNKGDPNVSEICRQAGYSEHSAHAMAVKQTKLYKMAMPQVIANMEAIRNKANVAILNKEMDGERMVDLAIVSKIFTHDAELLKGNATDREDKAIILPNELINKNSLIEPKSE